MAAAHTSVNEMSHVYLTNERRYNYTTPKSFLEQISLYFKLLTEKTDENSDRIQKLENGLTKLVSTSEQVLILSYNIIQLFHIPLKISRPLILIVIYARRS